MLKSATIELDYRNADLEMRLLEQARYGDMEAMNSLVAMHNGLINMVVNRYHRLSYALDEFERLSSCHLGFTNALKKFDPASGNTFATFAVRCMRRRVLRDFRLWKLHHQHVSRPIPAFTTNKGEEKHTDRADLTAVCPQEHASSKEQQVLLQQLLDQLPRFDRELLQQYHGLTGYLPHTIPELARRHKLPDTQIKLRLKQALLKMRQAHSSPTPTN